MFPKSIGTNRSSPGTLSGQFGYAGSTSESYTGNCLIASNLIYSNADASDVIEYEYWNGSAWVSSTFAGLASVPYSNAFLWRARLVNSYFGVTGSWITSSAATLEDTGGAAALDASLPAFAIFSNAGPLATTGTTLFLITVDVDKIAYSAARALAGPLRVRVTCTWNQDGMTSPGSTTHLFNFWPTMTAGWFQTDGPAQMACTNVGIADATIQFYIEGTIDGNWLSPVQTFVEFEALYGDSDIFDPATYGNKQDVHP